MFKIKIQDLKIKCLLIAPVIFGATAEAESLKMNLNDAINYALKNNRAIEQAADDREAAKWNLSASRRSFGPTLSWSSAANRIGGRYYNYYRERRSLYDHYEYKDEVSPAEVPPKYEAETTNTVNLSLPLYSGGRLESQKESAQLNLNAADLLLENTRQEVKYQTSQAFFQVMQYHNLMEVRQEEMQNLKEHLETVRTQYEVGTVAMADLLSTNVQLANSQQNYNSAQINYESAVATLNNLIGFAVDTTLVIEEELKYFPFDKDEDYCLEYALKHRPDGIAADFSVRSAKATVNQARAGTRPNISAVVSGSIVGEGAFKADHSSGEERFAAGLQMTWNIFDNNVTSADVNRAKVMQKKAESQAEEQLEKIRLDVHNAYTALRISEKNIKLSKETISQAQEKYLIAKVRYEEGVDTNLNVMDAQEKLTQARTNYFSALYSYNESFARLEKALGVPVGFDAKVYAELVAEGKVQAQALKNSSLDNDEVGK